MESAWDRCDVQRRSRSGKTNDGSPGNYSFSGRQQLLLERRKGAVRFAPFPEDRRKVRKIYLAAQRFIMVVKKERRGVLFFVNKKHIMERFYLAKKPIHMVV